MFAVFIHNYSERGQKEMKTMLLVKDEKVREFKVVSKEFGESNCKH